MLYKKKTPLYVLLIPSLIILAAFLYYPFVVNIINSFHNMKGIVNFEKPEFIGLQNYKTMLTDPEIHTSLINSLIIMGCTIVFQVGFALILALMVSSIKIGNQFFRTAFFFPIVISATAIGLMFNLFYNYNGGALNQLLSMMNIEPVFWLGEHALTFVSIPIIWQYVGFYFVIILTGLNAISQDIYDAAEVDGCQRLKRVFKITLPNIKGVISTCLVLAITGALKVFDLPWVIAPHGAPSGTTYFTGTYMYEMTFEIGNVDYGSAIAVLIVVFGVVISQSVNRILRERG